MTRIFGLFDTRAQAEDAAQRLLDAGVPPDALTIVAHDERRAAVGAADQDQEMRVAEGAATGGVLGLLAGIGLVALPALGLLAGLADPLVDFLGPQWAGAELPLRLLCCYAALAVYGVLLGPALQAAGHPGRLAALAWLRGLLGAAVFLGVGAAMTGRQAGVQAAAIATAAAATQLVVVTVTQDRKSTRLNSSH